MEYYVREVYTKYRTLKTRNEILNKPEAVWKFLRPKIGNECREHFYMLGVNNKNTVLVVSPISVGTISETIIHPREIFVNAVRELCSAIIVAHNHPTGNLLPSENDIRTTRRLMDAGEIIGIPVLDHVIITSEGFLSLKEEGYMG